MTSRNITHFKYLLIIIIFSFSLTLFATAHNDTKVNKEEYSQLKKLIDEGVFNFQIFKKAADLSPTPAQALAYLRQAKVLSPTDRTVILQTESTKETLNKDNLAKSFTSKRRILDLISPKSYLPFYILDYSLVGLSFLLLVLATFKPKGLAFSLTLILLLFLLIDKTGVTYNRSGKLKVVNSFSDILKSEGIVLDSLKTYASKDTSSQVTYVLLPGSEVDVNALEPENNDWIKVKFDNNRSGWVQYHPESLFIIKR